MKQLVESLRKDFPHLSFRQASTSCWSPAKKEVSYTIKGDQTIGAWGLLHELGHALLEHDTYRSDVELVLKEVDAWDKALEIAPIYNQQIDDEHVQDCLDTYRDWLNQRSTCPECGMNGLQHTPRLYRCINCVASWEVSPSRFCRPYRQKKRVKNKTSLAAKPQVMFQ
ncbi:MAG: hypothetical protein U5K77_00940 [Candidatus Saccharibacteria bacterium]|nr:hypothetical protein [Candidatus Saccharibacteria bacterium]